MADDAMHAHDDVMMFMDQQIHKTRVVPAFGLWIHCCLPLKGSTVASALDYSSNGFGDVSPK